MLRKFSSMALLAGLLVFSAACGTVATPVPSVAEQGDEAVSAEPTELITEEPTPPPPTATPEPTVAPPTATATPTEEATAEATEATAADAGGDQVAEAIAAGDVANGQTVFNAMVQTSSGGWMCASCHSVDASEARLVGPTLWNIHSRAEERLAESGDANAVDYIRNSILHPADYHVVADPPYPENLMPQNYGEVLTEQELADVVAYILTLGNPDA